MLFQIINRLLNLKYKMNNFFSAIYMKLVKTTSNPVKIKTIPIFFLFRKITNTTDFKPS